jgi:hypothetical protein
MNHVLLDLPTCAEPYPIVEDVSLPLNPVEILAPEMEIIAPQAEIIAPEIEIFCNAAEEHETFLPFPCLIISITLPAPVEELTLPVKQQRNGQNEPLEKRT